MPQTLGKEKMKNYLSFGGGVNSVAMMLLFHELEIEHEALYVWMPDHPKTHDYLMLLEYRGYNIKTIFADCGTVEGDRYHNLYDYCWHRRRLPLIKQRWCTDRFKIQTLTKYFDKPCFVNIGYAYDEQKRLGNIVFRNGIEYRYPLIEYELTRKGCINLIKRHNLPIPIKSGCFFCIWQSPSEWRKLRRENPELWCKATKLEDHALTRNPNQYLGKDISIKLIANEKNRFLFDDMSYPPCECGL